MDKTKLSNNLKNLRNVFDLNIFTICSTIYKNKNMINDYFKHMLKTPSSNIMINGFTLDFFIIVASIVIICFVAGLYNLITNWNYMSQYPKILSIIFLPFIPILSILIINFTAKIPVESNETETEKEIKKELKELKELRQLDELKKIKEKLKVASPGKPAEKTSSPLTSSPESSKVNEKSSSPVTSSPSSILVNEKASSPLTSSPSSMPVKASSPMTSSPSSVSEKASSPLTSSTSSMPVNEKASSPVTSSSPSSVPVNEKVVLKMKPSYKISKISKKRI